MCKNYIFDFILFKICIFLPEILQNSKSHCPFRPIVLFEKSFILFVLLGVLKARHFRSAFQKLCQWLTYCLVRWLQSENIWLWKPKWGKRRIGAQTSSFHKSVKDKEMQKSRCWVDGIFENWFKFYKLIALYSLRFLSSFKSNAHLLFRNKKRLLTKY